MTERRTLAIVFPAREVGGAEGYVETIARAAVARGQRVCAGFPSDPATDAFRSRLEQRRVRCSVLRLGEGHGHGFYRAVAAAGREFARTLRMLARERAGATLVSLPYPDGSIGAVVAAALFPARSVVVTHLIPDGFRFSLPRRLLYRLAKLTGQVWVAPSDDARARISRALGWPEAAIARIHYGVELGGPTANGDPADAHRRAKVRLGLSPDAVVMLTVARLSAQKGLDVLADAIPPVAERHPAARWVWAGEGDCREQLTEQLSALGVSDRVLLLGERADVPALLEAADVFVFPSRNEALGIALLEAMAAGVPVIASDLAAIREVVVDGLCGRLVPAGDAAALGGAMTFALEHPELTRQAATSARLRVAERFGIDEMVERTIATLARPASPGAARAPSWREPT